MASVGTNAVNFFRRKRQKVSQTQLLDLRLAQGAGGALGVSVLLLVGVAGYWQYLRVQVDDVRSQQQAQQRVVNQEAKNEAEYLIYSYRLEAVGELLGARASKKRALDFLQQISQPSLSFENIAYDDRTKVLNFRAKANTVFAVQSLLARLRSDEISGTIASLTLEDIKRDESGQYTIEVGVTLAGATKEQT